MTPGAKSTGPPLVQVSPITAVRELHSRPVRLALVAAEAASAQPKVGAAVLRTPLADVTGHIVNASVKKAAEGSGLLQGGASRWAGGRAAAAQRDVSVECAGSTPSFALPGVALPSARDDMMLQVASQVATQVEMQMVSIATVDPLELQHGADLLIRGSFRPSDGSCLGSLDWADSSFSGDGIEDFYASAQAQEADTWEAIPMQLALLATAEELSLGSSIVVRTLKAALKLENRNCLPFHSLVASILAQN